MTLVELVVYLVFANIVNVLNIVQFSIMRVSLKNPPLSLGLMNFVPKELSRYPLTLE